MPIYDFYCQHCKKKEERNTSFQDRNNQHCQQCKKKLTKLFSAPQIRGETVAKIKKTNDIIDQHLQQLDQNLQREGINDTTKEQLNISNGRYTNASQVHSL